MYRLLDLLAVTLHHLVGSHWNNRCLRGHDEGALSDRGSQRVGAARGIVHAMKFMDFKLELREFHTFLAGPTVCAWLSSAKWDRAPPNEALPLPLLAVCQLEEAAASALRSSDGQRIDLASVQVDQRLVLAQQVIPHRVPLGRLDAWCHWLALGQQVCR